jgi:hypothetical protein
LLRYGNFRKVSAAGDTVECIAVCGLCGYDSCNHPISHRQEEGAYTNPGGILIPVLSLLATGWFLDHLKRAEILGVILFIVIFAAIYAIHKYQKAGTA